MNAYNYNIYVHFHPATPWKKILVSPENFFYSYTKNEIFEMEKQRDLDQSKDFFSHRWVC